jgi:anaerobic selenocysteine-containing dehydrogenase
MTGQVSHRYRACNLCEAICGLDFRFEDGRLTAIRGDAQDPFSQGFICPKGNALLDMEADPDRLRRPLVRRGGDFQEIGWDDAIALAAERLVDIQSQHGNDAVAAYLGNPNVHSFGSIGYLPPLLKVLRSRNTFSASSVDQWPHQIVNRLMFGHQFLLPIPDIDRTEFLLMLGANPMASNGSLMTAPGMPRRLRALAARGQLIVVDPRRTETAAIASEHLAIQPDGDAFFLIGLLQNLRAIGPARIERYRDKLAGFDQALDAIASFDASGIEAACGISRADIQRTAEALYAAKTAVVYGRMGVSTQAFGSLCQWLIQLLNIYTGNLDREGGTLVNEPAIPITGPGTAPGQLGRWTSRVRGLPEFAGELPVAVLGEEILTPGPGQVRGLLTVAGNPVLSTPAGRALEGALRNLEFMVSIDIYINETTRHADLILPPASALSQPNYDLIFNAFAIRRVARLSQPLYPAADEERADWQILQSLTAACAARKGAAHTPLPEPMKLIAHGLKAGRSGLDTQMLLDAPHGLDLGPLRPSLLSRLETESGAIECAPQPLLVEIDKLARYAASDVAADSLRLIGRRELRSNNSWIHNAPRLIKGKPRHHLWVHPSDLASRGLTGASRVRLRSAVGAIDVDIQANTDIRPGVVCLPHGYGHQDGRNGQRLASGVCGESYNDLTDPNRLDGLSGNAALNGLEVWLEPNRDQ